MSNSDIIESGILECYALGMCSDSEKLEVEKLCAENTMAEKELVTIQKTLFLFGQAHQVHPKPEVKNNIFAQLNIKEPRKEEAKIITLAPKKYNFSIAASLALFGISVVANIVIYLKYQSANEQVLALSGKNSQMAETLKTNKVRLENMNSELAFIGNEQTSKIPLKGVAKSPESMVMIYWNKQTKEVYAEVKNLPQAAEGLQYQLWAIVDGKPVDAGMIAKNSSDSVLLKMNNFETAQAFAITLEKEGGSLSPTLTEMYVMGAVGS
ncbi:MAG: anti-sigma factor domain-containing protein [Candidatus Methylacidiphilales bacterium]